MGLGDFVGGIAESAGDIVGGAVDAGKNVAKGVGFAATHLDDAARGVGKGIQAAAKYTDEAVQGVGWLASHPAYWDDAAKTMIVDQFTDPVNIATNIGMLGLTIATGGGAGAAWMAKLGMGAKAGIEAAEGVSTIAKVGKGAAETAELGKAAKGVAEAAEVGAGASRLQRLTKGLDTALDAPRKFKTMAREAVGLDELTYIQKGRQSMAESFLARTGGIEAKEGGGILESARQAVGSKIAAAPGAPTLVGGGEASTFAKMNYRANQVSSKIRGARDFRSNLEDKSAAVQFLADPKGEAIDYATSHRSDIAGLAQEHSGEITRAKNKIFGDPADKKSNYATVGASAPESPAMADWKRTDDTTGFVSKKQASIAGPVTTTQSTMPNQIGPSNWYGGQGNYASGRGFRSQNSASTWGTTPWTQDPAIT